MRIVVVGSGVSGAHAALTLLERGYPVELWDVGRDEASFPEAALTFHDLKSRLADPVTYFLGADLGAIVPPAASELLRYPPSRQFLASPQDPLWPFVSDGFTAQGSFTKGGLANGWGANTLAFDENDITEWPAVWCLFSIGLVLAIIKTPLRAHLHVGDPWWRMLAKWWEARRAEGDLPHGASEAPPAE